VSDPRRILIATDVPFWNRSTGAEQRIAALARVCSSPPFSLSVFFLGSADRANRFSMGLPGATLYRFRPGRRWPAWFARWRCRRGRTAAGTTASGTARTLEDYCWPEAAGQFRSLVRSLRPDAIVFEYVTMAYLAESIRSVSAGQPRRPTLILDSHDVLHERCRQFRAAGRDHWLEIDERQEIAAAQSFDLILAIQEAEGEWFRRHVPSAEVLVIGHSFDFSEVRIAHREDSGAGVVLGYFGSRNESNVDAIGAFVEQAWPAVRAAQPATQLLIGGTVNDAPAVSALSSSAGVRCVREFPSVGDFYAQIDIAINPVRFGTGLKIKNVEALAYGRPLVTTAGGCLGIPAAFGGCCRGAADVASMSELLLEWIRDPALRRARSRQAEETAKRELSDLAVWSELRRRLMA
jgi:glycosyltransferase involved in cell wall biosynthesis